MILKWSPQSLFAFLCIYFLTKGLLGVHFVPWCVHLLTITILLFRPIIHNWINLTLADPEPRCFEAQRMVTRHRLYPSRLQTLRLVSDSPKSFGGVHWLKAQQPGCHLRERNPYACPSAESGGAGHFAFRCRPFPRSYRGVQSKPLYESHVPVLTALRTRNRYCGNCFENVAEMLPKAVVNALECSHHRSFLRYHLLAYH